MAALEPDDSFRLGRLRLIRLPPTSISLPQGAKRTIGLPVELTVGITDDYGTDIGLFESIDLNIEVLDATTLSPSQSISLKVDGSAFSKTAGSSAVFTFTPSRGPFHTLKLCLSFSPPISSVPKAIRFRLTVAGPSTSAPPSPADSLATRRMRQLIGESRQDILETWDDKRYLFLSVTSGEVEIRTGNEGVSSTKGAHSRLPLLSWSRLTLLLRTVQTALRTICLPSLSAAFPPPSVSIVERPGLNNSTGQRLWDCAIGLACFLSLHSDALDSAVPLTTTTSSDDEKPRTKRQRTAGLEGPLRVVELGAGCALASMCAQHVLADVEGKLSIVATDVKPTVETTLAENLAANSVSSRQPAITASVLDWGKSTCLQVCDARPPASPSSPPPHLTLLGSDILYNPSSHSLLLDTLLAFCRPTDSSLTASARALIAYKKRTDGDGAFFGMASEAGLDVRKVWEWGEVGVWSFE
ncbi:hypothetical protein JCM21900_002626 [Sporobolomyces salmonicolor]